MPNITVMIKPASGLCNMKCDYCFYSDEIQNREASILGIMSDEVMEQVVKKTLSFATEQCNYIFQGGEPTLAGISFFEKWIEYEKRYNINNVEISHSLQTNGYLLNKKWCDFLFKNKFLIGLSIDGIKSTHDLYRKDYYGKGTFEKVMNAANLLKDANIEFNILTVVNSKTAEEIKNIYEFYKKQNFKWQQYIACLDPIGVIRGKKEYSITPEAYGKFLIELFKLWKNDLYEGTQPYIRQFENYIGILLGAAIESCEQRGVCSHQTIVESDGSVYPCDFYAMDSYKLGNFLVDDFDNINHKRQAIKFVEQSYNHSEKCKKCIYFYICRGGGRRHREQLYGDEGINYFCEAYKMFFDECLLDMKKIAIKCLKG